MLTRTIARRTTHQTPNRLAPARGIVLLTALVAAVVSCSNVDATPTGDEGAGDEQAQPAGGSEPLRFEGADGVVSTIDDTSRLVVLNGDINEVVFALGLGDDVVGNDISATHPPEAAEVDKIGYQRALSAEGILSLEPTLVIGNEVAGPPQVFEQIRSAGVPVVILPVETDLDSAGRKVETVADLLGIPDEGAELAEQIRQDISEVLGRVDRDGDGPRAAFVYARGADLLLMAGSETPTNSLITAAGGVDVGAEAGIDDFAPLTAEALVAADPEVLILTEGGLESLGGVDGLLAVPGVAETTAGRTRRVVVADDLMLLGLTPRASSALELIVDELD